MIACCIVAFVIEAQGSSTLGGLQIAAAEVAEYQTDHPLTVLVGFLALYIVATAIPFPGAIFLTLASGALFGEVVGTMLVSVGATIGATLTFLVSRFLLRDAVRSRFGKQVAAVDRGLTVDGAMYLFTLRMTPLAPFVLVNLLMGVTQIRTWTFAWASQLGMLLYLMIVVSAGAQLAQIHSLSQVITAKLIMSLTLLGAAPWLARRAVLWLKGR